MNDKPKSIWKKSWKGPRAILFWLLIVSIAAFLAAVAIAAITFVSTPMPFFAWRGGFGDFIGCTSVVMFWFIVAVAVAFIFYGTVRWHFCWRNLKRTLFVIACFVTLIAIFYAEEDWRGWHAWNKFKHEWEAKGEHFDFVSVIPPPVPDDQNFAMTPVWIAEVKLNMPEGVKAWYGDRIYGEEVSKLASQLPISVSGVGGNVNFGTYHSPEPPNMADGDWRQTHAIGLKQWQSYYRDLGKAFPAVAIPITPQPQSPAADVLLALSKYDQIIEKLRAASALPHSRFPIQYNADNPAAIMLPHLAALRRFAEILQLRAIAELQNGQSEKALDDVKLMQRLTDSIHTEPFLISQLVRIIILQIALQPVWEGLAEHRWSSAQLVELNQELAGLDFLSDYKLAMRGGELVLFQGGMIDYLRRNPEQYFYISGDNYGNQARLFPHESFGS